MSAANEIKYEIYEPAKLNLLLQLIQNAFANQQRQDYEIYVDNLKVVARTSNPELFNSFSDFITADTRTIQVVMFRGGSHQSDKYFFRFKGTPQAENTLSGITDGMPKEEWEKKERERIAKDMRFEQLEKENELLSNELEKREKIIGELHQRIEDAKEGNLLSYGEIGNKAIQLFLNSPMGKNSGLAGIFGVNKPNTTQKQATQAEPEESASFSRYEEVREPGAELNEMDRGYLILLRDMQAKLPPFQLSSVMHILDLITQCPIAIGPTQKMLNNFLINRAKKQGGQNE